MEGSRTIRSSRALSLTLNNLTWDRPSRKIRLNSLTIKPTYCQANMAFSSAWFDSLIAITADEVGGDGCHPDEAQTLSDYIHGIISKQEAASRITTPVLSEADPPQHFNRVLYLLFDVLAESSVEGQNKTLDLLSQILALPPSFGIDWAELIQFGYMWHDLHRICLSRADVWEDKAGPLGDPNKIDEWRQHFETIGRAEAKMYVRGFDTMVFASDGYDILNLVCSDRPGLDILMSKIFAWLEFAGWKLKAKAESENTTVERFRRPLPHSQNGE